MGETVSDFFWERLHQWGVRRFFGYPGDGINGLLGVAEARRFRVRPGRHEDVPIVVQHTRLDSRPAQFSLLSTMAFSG